MNIKLKPMLLVVFMLFVVRVAHSTAVAQSANNQSPRAATPAQMPTSATVTKPAAPAPTQPAAAAASTPAQPLTLTRLSPDLKPMPVPITYVQGLRVNQTCVTNPNCLALKYSREKMPPQKPNATGLAGHPAAKYCLHAGGRNIILTQPDRAQVDYCLFSDESMVDSWDMYYKHH